MRVVDDFFKLFSNSIRYFLIAASFACTALGHSEEEIAFQTEPFRPQIVDDEILEKIDGVLILINQFFEVSHEVAKWKWNHNMPIEDKQREESTLQKLKERALMMGLPPHLVSEVVKAQMQASKLLQEDDFNRWTEEGVDLFADVRDLKKELRPQIDAIREKFLIQFKELLSLLKKKNLTEVIHWRAGLLLGAEGVNDFIRDCALQPLIMLSAEVSMR